MPSDNVTVFHEYSIYQALWHSKRTAEATDPTPYWLLKNCAVEWALTITHLYNLNLTSGIHMIHGSMLGSYQFLRLLHHLHNWILDHYLLHLYHL
jgi:hypothetical protein